MRYETDVQDNSLFGGRSPVVCAHNWGLKHPGRKNWVLRHVNLDIYAGEHILILGASGAGKSSFLQAIAGVLEGVEQEGELKICTRDPSLHTVGAGMVLQDPNSQVILQRLGDDIAFGCENLCVEPQEIVRRSKAAMKLVGLELDWDYDTYKLSGGQKQRMALAGVLAMQPQLLLLDEPTANIDPEGKLEMVEAVARVLDAHQDMTLIIVEHMLDPWIDKVDRIIVLGNQEVLLDGKAHDIIRHERAILDELGVWLPGDHAALAQAYAKKPSVQLRETTPLLQAQQLSIGYRAEEELCSGFNLDINVAESLCIVGKNGAGKSSLALTLAGALPALSGKLKATAELLAAGYTHAASSSPAAWKSRDYLGRMSFVFQEPEYQFVADTVYRELELSLQGKDLSAQERAEKIEATLSVLSLKQLAQAHPMSLSGGEKRRLSVATALIHEPRVLFLDEPSFGQDKKNWCALVGLLQQLQAQGCAVVSVTHDEAYIAAMADRVIELKGGKRPARDEGCVLASEVQTHNRAVKSGVWPYHYHKLHPLIQLIAVVLMTTPLLLSLDHLSAGLALTLECALLLTLRFPLSLLLKRLIPLLYATPLLGISMLLYAKAEGTVYVSLGTAAISDNSIYLALSLMFRIFALATPALALFPQLDIMRMADGLIAFMHAPARPVLASLSGLRMMSLVREDYQALQYAHRLRGVEPRFAPVRYMRQAFSLCVFALRRSAKLALAMEARAFGMYENRSCVRETKLSAFDYGFLAISALIPVCALISAYLYGSFRLLGW